MSIENIKYSILKNEFTRVLNKYGMNESDIETASKIFADNTLDGIFSHGINRFPRMIDYIEKGYIDLSSKTECINSFNGMECWDGHMGLGPLNACRAMDRACELAEKYGIGLVALGNNNHWMRGGYYGWQAAEKGYISISFSNSMPNMPVWGGIHSVIGNNPLVISVPSKNGKHMVLDMAMSQFSWGKIEDNKIKDIELPVYGGYDENGKLSKRPEDVEKGNRLLPAGYWKGSGLSIIIELIITILSGGKSVREIGELSSEISLSQVFIAIDPLKFRIKDQIYEIVENLKTNIKNSEIDMNNTGIFYPGEREFLRRKKYEKNGIPVNKEIWDRIKQM